MIANKSIASYHPSDRRFSMLYHAEVEQYALHREAYDYYFKFAKNIEESGSLVCPYPFRDEREYPLRDEPGGSGDRFRGGSDSDSPQAFLSGDREGI